MSDIEALRRPAVVFCDFDGTITVEDVIVAVWKRFGRPGWRETMEAILARRLSLKEGVARVFGDIPSAERQDIIDYTKGVVRFRDGFREFLVFCKEQRIDFVVASGGIDFFVAPIMAPFAPYITRMYTIPADFSGETIRLRRPYGCETCGLCKAEVMAEFPNTYRILIGDSLTDFHGAEHADVTLLYEVEERERFAGELFSNGNHQPQVSQCQFIFSLFIAMLDFFSQLLFFLGRQKTGLPYFPQIHLDRVNLG